MLYIPFYSLNSQIFGTKPLPRRRFLQHYYRGANVETQKPPKAHRSPIDVLQWSPNLQHAYSHPNEEGVVILKCEKIHFFSKKSLFSYKLFGQFK